MFFVRSLDPACRVDSDGLEWCMIACFFFVKTVMNVFGSLKRRVEFLKGKYLEEYMVLNMKTGNGKVGRIEN